MRAKNPSVCVACHGLAIPGGRTPTPASPSSPSRR
jgi:hypothetical protein